MWTKNGLAAARRIGVVGVPTPLIVPSFSSRSFPAVSSLFTDLADELYGACLVSAFDLATRRLEVEVADIADLVLIDSGVYETKPVAVAVDGFHPAPSPDTWTRREFRSFLEELDASASVVAVSFDHYGPIDEQIELATQDFAKVPSAATDFLLKPLAQGKLVEPDGVREIADRLTHFQVIGVTEQELGTTLLDRCTNVMALRRQLGREGLDVPVHVFGTITPHAMISYFLCGADVFDGLNWLRFVYGTGSLQPLTETALDEGEWRKSDYSRGVENAMRSLRYLEGLQGNMRTYATSGSIEESASAARNFEAAERLAAAAAAVLESAGEA